LDHRPTSVLIYEIKVKENKRSSPINIFSNNFKFLKERQGFEIPTRA